MISKLISINSVISKVVRDLGLGDDEVRYQDMIEWASEGLLLIGSYYQFQEKEAVIVIEDHKGVLPCDFYKSIRFLDSTSLGDVASGTFWSNITAAMVAGGFHDPDTSAFSELDPLSFQKLQLMSFRSGNDSGAFSNSLKRVSDNLMGGGATYTGGPNSYSVNFNTVTATFRYGYISLRYLAIPVDDEGYPLVPDDVSFQEALMWRVVEKMCLRGHEFKNKQLTFETAKFYWNKYCVQARAAANAPDNDPMEMLSNIYNTLIPNQNRYENDFNGLGTPQR